MTPDEGQVNLPLRCECVDGVIQFSIGQATLRFAAEHHPDWWDGESSEDVPNIKVTDTALFAAEVVRAINEEDEAGNTLLTRMLDAAITRAVENGCEGVDHE